MEQHTADLAGALAERGHSVHVLGHKTYRDKFPAGVRFHPCPMSLGRKNLWLRWKIQRTLLRIRPDVVHAHGNKAANLAAKTKQAHWQAVGTIHGTKSSTRIFEDLDKVIAVSQAIYDQTHNPNKHLIFNGVSRQQSSSAAFPFKGDIKVVAAGRLEAVKGFDKLLQAWQRVRKTVPQAHLTVFGEGSLKSRLVAMTSSKGLTNSVTFAGFHENIGDILQHADLLVISSEREGFPYVLAEALVAGCPVLSTPVSGCQELLPATALTRDFSAEAIADRLVSALKDLHRFKESQKGLFEYANNHLTVDAMTDAIVAVYQA
ncbi:MAG: glycosyltransferase [Marinobacter sp.]|nr:glycosyltransferase [Marinobacter sp.]